MPLEPSANLYIIHLNFAILLKFSSHWIFPSRFLMLSILGEWNFLQGQCFHSSEWLPAGRLVENAANGRNRFFWKGVDQKWSRVFWLQLTAAQFELPWYWQSSLTCLCKLEVWGKWGSGALRARDLDAAWFLLSTSFFASAWFCQISYFLTSGNLPAAPRLSSFIFDTQAGLPYVSQHNCKNI